MQKKSRETQFLRDVFRGWYGRSYRTSKQRFGHRIGAKLQSQSHLAFILNQWFRVARTATIGHMRLAMHCQAKPTTLLALIYLLRGDFELFFSAWLFRGWIRYTKRRAKWKRFVKWAAESDEDKEFSYRLLCTLKRAAQQKVMQRTFIDKPKFFPFHCPISFEFTIKRVEEGMNNKSRHWRFATEPEGKLVDVELNKTTLIRCLLVYLDKSLTFERIKFGGNKAKLRGGGSLFRSYKTVAELRDQVHANMTVFWERQKYKLQRDHAILCEMLSHMSAGWLSEVNKEFTTRPLSIALQHFDENISQLPIVVFPDLEESVVAIQYENETGPPKIPLAFGALKQRYLEAFRERLRHPESLAEVVRPKRPFATTRSVADLILSVQNPMIVPYMHRRRQRESPDSFNLERFRLILDEFPTADDMAASLQRFFTYCNRVAINISKIICLTPDLYADMKYQKRRAMIRNISAFVADFLGHPPNEPIPLKIKAPQVTAEVVNAVITLHAALKQTSLAQYCDECPFTTKISFAAQIVQATRVRLWRALKLKFSILDFPGPASMNRGGSAARFKLSSPARFKTQGSEETFNASDAVLAVFLLPFIFTFDAVIDFVTDELINGQRERGHN
jgi:hypothetical protein